MSANGKKILSFLNDNYEFMLRVFNSSKQHNFSIKTDLLVEYCNEYNVNIQRLKEFKIVREHSNSEYSIYYEYRQFFEFLLDDFKPVLDASIKIYKDLIVQYFEQLQEAKNKNDHNKVNELVNMIIYEIDKFSIRVENNTKQLLTETRKLKANEKQDDYLDKVLKANKWIDDYIKPLNDVLDKELEHHVLQANIKQFTKEDVYHIQHVNSADSRLKAWINVQMHGVATKYLQNYLNWFRVKEKYKEVDIIEKVIQAALDTTANERFINIERSYLEFIKKPQKI